MFAVPKFIKILVGCIFLCTANSLYAYNTGYRTSLGYTTISIVMDFGESEGDSLSYIHFVTNKFSSNMPKSAKITNPVKYSNGIGTPNGAKSVVSQKTQISTKNHKKFAGLKNCCTFALRYLHNGQADSICNHSKRIGVAFLNSYCLSICGCRNSRESYAFSVDNHLNKNFLQMRHPVKNCHKGNNSTLVATPPNGAKSVSSTEALKNLLWERAENFKSIISPHTRHQLLQLFTPQPLSWRQKMAVRFNVQINENERVANNITRCVRWISWEDFRRKYSSNKVSKFQQTNDEIFQFLWSLSPLEFEWLKKIFLTSYEPNQAFLHNNLSKLFSLIIKK